MCGDQPQPAPSQSTDAAAESARVTDIHGVLPSALPYPAETSPRRCDADATLWSGRHIDAALDQRQTEGAIIQCWDRRRRFQSPSLSLYSPQNPHQDSCLSLTTLSVDRRLPADRLGIGVADRAVDDDQASHATRLAREPSRHPLVIPWSCDPSVLHSGGPPQLSHTAPQKSTTQSGDPVRTVSGNPPRLGRHPSGLSMRSIDRPSGEVG